MHRLLCVSFILLVGPLLGQTSDKYNSQYAPFYRAEDLFLKEQYAAARKEFKEFSQNFQSPNDPLYIKARYYEGLSALELFQNDGVLLLKEFNQNYPESIYRNAIFFRLGKYFYQKKDYPETIEWFNKLKLMDLEEEEKDEYSFKSGYAHFEENHLVEARSNFHEVKDSDSQYGPPSLYYYSHIAYVFGSYQTALEGFLKLKSDSRFSKVAPYYITQIYYLQGRYNDVITFAPDVMDSIPVANEKDINLLIGDSYFKTGRYAESVPYLEKYNRSATTSRELDYQLGFAYYKSGKYDVAIPFLDRATKGNDSLAQIAFYQIGECFLQLGKFVPARSAFEQAAGMSDENVREDALYQFAVLSYKLDLNPYDEAVIALERYLKEYPNSKRKNDVYQYLVNVYTTTNNYSKALQSLDRLPNKDIRLKTAYQVISFNAGVEQYQKKNYDEAIRLFELVDKYPIDALISGKAKFWSGDARFEKGEYRRSVQNYREFLNTTGIANNQLKLDAYYNMGYAYLAMKDTLQAIESLKLYTQQTSISNKRKLADAYMRIGDGYYSMRQNPPAVAAYKEALVLKSGYEDQALYYLGKTYGYMDKISDKISVHKEILNNYPSSKYVQVSILEIAASFKGQGNYNESLKYYEQIVRDYPSTIMVKDAMIEIADIYYKKQDFLRCETEYKKVLDKYNKDRVVCETCSKGLVELYRTMKEPDRLQMIVEKYPCVNLSADEQEELYYSPAFDLYRDSNFVKAMPQIQKYLDKYPSGKYANEMKVFLGNCYFNMNDIPQGIRTYQDVLDGPNTGYTEFMAVRVSQYMYNNGKYSEALPYYKKLEAVSAKPEVIYNAQLGVMRSSFLMQMWSDAATYATKVLSNSQVNTTIRLEAYYAKGMSLYRIESLDEAKSALEWVVKNTTTVLGAEAKFTLAELYYKKGQLGNSDKEVRELLKMKPTYNYWVARGLILQTRTLIAENDLFQAEQTLKSVRDHYPEKTDGIILEADQLWDELMQLKNQPKNIEPVNKPIIEVDGKK